MNDQPSSPWKSAILFIVALGLGYGAFRFHEFQEQRRDLASAIISDLKGLQPAENNAHQAIRARRQRDELTSAFQFVTDFHRRHGRYPGSNDALLSGPAGNLDIAEPIAGLHPSLASRLLIGRLDDASAMRLAAAGIGQVRVVDSRLPCPAAPGNSFRPARRGGCGTPAEVPITLRSGDRLLFWRGDAVAPDATVVALGLGADSELVEHPQYLTAPIDHAVKPDTYNRYIMLLELPAEAGPARLFGIASANGTQLHILHADPSEWPERGR